MDADVQNLTRTAIDLSGSVPGGRLRKPIETVPIGSGGSDRQFYRIVSGDRTAILMVQHGGGPEFERYLSLGDFLARCGIGVPRFYGVDGKRGAILMEDFSDTHLEDAVGDADEDHVLILYRQCIETLVRLSSDVAESMYRNEILTDRVFSESTLLGESDYFIREFLLDYCGIDPPGGFDSERSVIARTVAEEPCVFMHRDFQSRNIMIKEDRIRIIDFQTAHRGPGLYDAASLLKDPYHPLAEGLRRTLLEELHGRLRESGAAVASGFDEFTYRFTIAGIQRHMQALAAFARLGIKKEKHRFLESIPNGLSLLEGGIREINSFPVMQGMIASIREKLTKGR
ncbi:MAG: phosphotransferase [bacterium]|nr:MAG: phosphotransferase [bacterium]